ncbi:fibronectin type III domain-containing protein [Bacillus sp. 3255]|uniref:fibronectin type III domain-containing protein n=1 Tax=Bacillus sp. 3255 TaxID=2817904 RepID=UPI002865A78F|nr:fibronectin type III domain-containing protein [Bacillus sp. 3255]MDR6883008.1 chitodextrinase [Bacillus sp. 3255]
MTGIEVSNDSVPNTPGAADLTFTINGKTRVVKAGEVVTGRYKPFTVVTINSTVPWRAEGIQTIGGFAISPPADVTPPDNVTNLEVSALTATSLTLTWVASASGDCVGYDIFRGSTLLASVTGTTYNVTGLTQATQYTFTVKAKDAVPNIASGTSTTVTTSSSADTTPPANVTSLTTANITQTGLTLNWTASASSDVASYDIYNGSTFLANVTATTYNVNGLAASTSYTFWVKAKDGSGNAASGTNVSATTSAIPTDTTAPSNVTNLTASGPTQTGVTLNWTAATDNVAVTGYDIYNGASLVTTVTGTSYNVTGLTAGTQYTFTVKAKDAAGNVASGTSTTFTTSAPADTTPPIITANPAPGAYSSVQNVTLSSNESNTTIFYTTNGDTPTTSSAQYSSAIAVNASMSINAIGRDQAGNVSSVQNFAYTINVSDTTPPNPVTGLSAGTPTSNSVPLSWTNSVSGDVTAYEAAYSTDGTNFTVASAVINPSSNSYTVAGLTGNTPYTFRIVAIDGAGNRSTAVTTTATTAAPTPSLLNITDDFNRADSASLGTTATGSKAWSGGIQIIGNQAGSATSLTSTGWTFVDAAKSDNLEISVDITIPSTFSATMVGILFRYISAGSLYAFGFKSDTKLGIFTTSPAPTGGAETVDIPADKTIVSVAGSTHTLKVKLSGQLVECFMDGVLQFSFLDTLMFAATKHGMALYGATVPKFDNFSIQEVVDLEAPRVSNTLMDGTYPTPQTVTLSTINTETASIYYTTDGSTPDNTKTPYSAPISIPTTTTLKYRAIDGLGNVGAVYTRVYTITPIASGSVVIADTFDRADSATSLGTSSSGHTWTSGNVNGLGIISNAAYSSFAAGTLLNWIDSAYASGLELSVDVAADVATQYGIVFRYTDPSNYLELVRKGTAGTHTIQLIKHVANIQTVIVQSVQAAIAAPYKLRVVLEGKRIRGYLGATLVIDLQTSVLFGATKVGLVSNGATDSRMDNFEVKVI